jgi:drug/metabolite transporter (DMT)-like permease
MTDQIQSGKARHAGLLAFSCLVVVGIFLALSLIIAKLADQQGASRLSFLMLALTGAGLILLVVTAVQKQLSQVTRPVVEYAFVTGLLLALTNALAFLAVRHVGAGFISVSFAFPVLLTWVFAVMLGLESMRLQRLAGVGLALAGGLVLASGKVSGSSAGGVWILLVLAVPILLAVGNIYRSLCWPRGTSPLFLASLMLLAGGVLLLPFALLFESATVLQLLTTEKLLWLLLAEVAVFSVLYFLFFVLQRLAGPVYLSQVGTVAAIFGTVIAVSALGEAVPPNFALAGALVAVGMVIFQRFTPKHTAVPSPA